MTTVLDRRQSVISIILVLDDDYLDSDEGWWVVQLAKNHERKITGSVVPQCGVSKYEAKD